MHELPDLIQHNINQQCISGVSTCKPDMRPNFLPYACVEIHFSFRFQLHYFACKVDFLGAAGVVIPECNGLAHHAGCERFRRSGSDTLCKGHLCPFFVAVEEKLCTLLEIVSADELIKSSNVPVHLCTPQAQDVRNLKAVDS